MLQGVGELREGVWDTHGFTFRVLLIPYGPFTEVATASEAMLPRVPLLKALEFRSLSLGCLGSASVLELFELLFRKCRIFLQNLGQGFCWGTLQKIKIFPTVSPRSIYEFI